MKTLAIRTPGARSRALSTATGELLDLGRQEGWDVALLGYAPPPTQPVRAGDWFIVPAHLDTSPMPERTQQRIAAIFQNGLRPATFVVVHEAPKLLPASTTRSEDITFSLEAPARRVLRERASHYLPLAIGVGLLAVVGGVLLAVLMLIGLVAIAGIGLVGLLSAAATIDPVLVAVMDDGAWVEIDRWWTA